jgi:hypothetical protein
MGDKSRRITWAGHIEHTGGMKHVYEHLVGKRKNKRPLWRFKNEKKKSVKLWTRYAWFRV